MSLVSDIPDLLNEESKSYLPVDLVGIHDLEMPVQLADEIKRKAKLSILVSLEDQKHRGIHMSRLYSCLHDYFSNNIVSLSGMKKLLLSAIQSQKGISYSGRIRLESEWPVIRKSLKSRLSGWREYPFYFEINYLKKEDSFQYMVGGEVLYSSTCPCSASLSRQIIKGDFEKAFFGKNSLKKNEVLDYLSDKKFLSATPHAQKSRAYFKLSLDEDSKKTFSLLKTIDEIEKALGTAVQTAVKQEDEAEFARLNANHLMFCEDAVRKLALVFKAQPNILDYFVRVQHYESLHPFTVESSIVKGIEGGWRA